MRDSTLLFFLGAIHESSHAVVRLANGDRIKSIRVNPDGSGKIHSSAVYSYRRLMLGAAAGVVGEAIYLRKRYTFMEGGQSDLATLIAIRRGFSKSKRHDAAAIAATCQRAYSFLSRADVFAVVCELAQQLVDADGYLEFDGDGPEFYP